jgi:hypothetical protein
MAQFLSLITDRAGSSMSFAGFSDLAIGSLKVRPMQNTPRRMILENGRSVDQQPVAVPQTVAERRFWKNAIPLTNNHDPKGWGGTRCEIGNPEVC